MACSFRSWVRVRWSAVGGFEFVEHGHHVEGRDALVATTAPPASSAAPTNGIAQVFSNMMSTAVVPGSMMLGRCL